jgi:hypothetical protein
MFALASFSIFLTRFEAAAFEPIIFRPRFGSFRSACRWTVWRCFLGRSKTQESMRKNVGAKRRELEEEHGKDVHFYQLSIDHSLI